MKVEIQQNEKEKGKDVFPHLGIYEDGMIVLFTGKEDGICLVSNKYNVFYGTLSEGWSEDYKLFTGKITLSND